MEQAVCFIEVGLQKAAVFLMYLLTSANLQ